VLGQRVNNFEVVRLIGEGGMGTVYEAKHPLIRRRVAIKVLRHEFTRDLDLVRRFFNEARATSEIRHPNIVEVVDVGTLPDGVPYLVMELLEGESLSECLASVGRLDAPNAAFLISQAADALQAAHENAIIHRDLKPDNLFLVRPTPEAPALHVKVLDFGIAKLRGDPSGSSVRTRPGAVLGTPAYMSPEQCRGNPDEIGPATDIYSLGVILYEMLCGEPPFAAVGLGEVLMMHMATEPVPPSQRCQDVATDLEAVIMKALAKQPQHRFESMAALAAALRATAAYAQGASGVLPREPTGPVIALVPKGASTPGAKEIENKPTLVASTPSASSRPFDTTVAGAGASLKPITIPPRLKPSPLRPLAAALTACAALGAALWFLMRPGEAESAPKLSAGLTEGMPNLEPLWSKLDAQAELVPASASGVSALPRPLASARVHPPGPPARRVEPAASVPAEEARAPSAAVEPALPPAPKAKLEVGYLSLDSAPWANVSTGGRSLGTTPLVRVSLPPGRHVLKLENPELGRSTSYTVEITSGQGISRFVGWGND